MVLFMTIKEFKSEKDSEKYFSWKLEKGHTQRQNTEYQNGWHIHKTHVQKENVDQKPIYTRHQFMKWNIQSY